MKRNLKRGYYHPDIDWDYYVWVCPTRVEYYKNGKQIEVWNPQKHLFKS